jgi:hypothetical protein
MPYKVWGVGEEVLAADFQTYVQAQTVPQFPNPATRDSQWGNAPVGAVCVTTEYAAVGQILHWVKFTAAASGWRLAPGQTLAARVVSSATNGIASGADLPQFDVSFNAYGGPVILSMRAPIQNTGAEGSCALGLYEGATVVENQLTQTWHGATGLSTHEASLYLSPLTGTHTYKVVNTGPLAVNLLGNATRRGILRVMSV